jgi:very-short-patch-repair endonuclease
MTDAERKLWSILRCRYLENYRFRKQVPLGSYIVDFLSYELRLIIEVDGGQHAEQVEYDTQRTNWLEKQGYRVIRFWNNEVLTNLSGVAEVILRECVKSTPPSCPFRLRNPASPKSPAQPSMVGRSPAQCFALLFPAHPPQGGKGPSE